jgi:hypothetical protein
MPFGRVAKTPKRNSLVPPSAPSSSARSRLAVVASTHRSLRHRSSAHLDAPFYDCWRQRISRIAAAGNHGFRHAPEIGHEVLFLWKLLSYTFVNMERNGRNVIDSELREIKLTVVQTIEFDDRDLLHGSECGSK